MKGCSIFGAIFTALGEYLNRGGAVTKIDMNLAILAIDLLFAAHVSRSSHT